MLRLLRPIGLRRHDGLPRWWEILRHWALFSVVFELILPTMPRLFTHTQDPWNAVAYLVGGVAVGTILEWHEGK
jgi:hypothetical protein